MVQAISRLLPPRGVVLADAGAHLAWLGYYLELKAGQNFRKPGTYGPMGIAVYGAIGVKFGAMDRTGRRGRRRRILPDGWISS